MLKVPERSPPVPQVSTQSACSEGVRGRGRRAAAKGVDEAGELCGGLVAGGEGAK